MKKLTQVESNMIVHKLNQISRKRYECQTPQGMFTKLSSVALSA